MASSDYISREALKELFDGINDCADLVFEPDDQICAKQHSSCGSCRWIETKRAIQKRVMSIPAADVRPVVRAHWYWDKDGMDWNIGAWRCSACKAMSPMWWNCDRGSPMHKSGHSFCPNCGAGMREANDEKA